MLAAFETWLHQRFPGGSMTRLSDSNNDVYLIEEGGSRWVTKLVTDSDIPLEYTSQVNRVLSDRFTTQNILTVHRATADEPFDALLCDFIEGTDLATALADIEPETVSSTLIDFVEAMTRVPEMREGFGLYKREAPVFSDHGAFARHYAQRYWSRCRTHFDPQTVKKVDAWLDDGLVNELAGDTSFGVVAIDCNLRNFVVTDERAIAILNVPIVGYSTTAQAIGAIALHLRHHAAHDRLITQASERLDSFRPDLVHHFELWGLLGIVVLCGSASGQHRGVGSSPVPLRDDITSLVEQRL